MRPSKSSGRIQASRRDEVFTQGWPRPLIETNAYVYTPSPTPYDVTKDGERFVFAEPERSSANELRVVVNWDRALSH